MTTLEEAAQSVERLREQVKEAVLFYDRLSLVAIVQDIVNLPDDGFIATVVWPEDPNEDGTFDVSFESSRDATGKEIADLGDWGGFPVGRYGEPNTTSWDVFRLDENDIESVLSVAKIRAFGETA